MIGIDIGRKGVKLYTIDKRITFPSAVGEWRERKLGTGGNYELEYQDKKYFVGDLAEESYCQREMTTESKIHEETLLLFLTAIAISGESNVTIGLPVSQHDENTKLRYKSLLEGQHFVGLNNAPKKEYIVKVGVVAESTGVYWNEILNNKGELIKDSFNTERIIDVGSRTINYCTIKNRKYIDRESGTLQYGTIDLGNAGDMYFEQFARKIVADLSKVWSKPYLTLISGGGGMILFDYLKPHFDCRLVEDPIFANAKGFYKMGVASCGK